MVLKRIELQAVTEVVDLTQVGSALLVIEEYDKLDCPTRAMFRQLFENLHSANITSGRCGTNGDNRTV